jgi:DNA polymerase-3 subunit beta
MRVKISQEKLAALLERIYRVVERKQTIPILGHVHLKAENGKLTARGTNLDIEIVVHARTMVEKPGEVTVNAHVLNDIIRKSKSETTIIMDDEGRMMQLKVGRGTFQLPTLPPEQFPARLFVGADVHKFQLSAQALCSLIEPIESCIATETTRTYLTGIYFHVVDGKLRTVATDSVRLGLTEIPAPDGSHEMPGIIVPRNTVVQLHRMLLADLSATITVELTSQKVQFMGGDVTITSKLLEGVYPDYQRIIPKNNNKLVTVAKEDLKDALDRVSTVGIERRGAKFAFRKKCLELTVQGVELGTATEEIYAGYDGEPLEIGFHGRFFMDLVSQLDESVEILLADVGSPAIIRELGTTHPFFVIMPMRV